MQAALLSGWTQLVGLLAGLDATLEALNGGAMAGHFAQLETRLGALGAGQRHPAIETQEK